MDTFKFNKEQINGQTDLYSKKVKAGRRTYFFDVKSNTNKDLYITVTESRKQIDENGNISFCKQKLFLYKEDFGKFSEALIDVLEYVKGKTVDIDKQITNKSDVIPSKNNYVAESNFGGSIPVFSMAAIDEEFDRL